LKYIYLGGFPPPYGGVTIKNKLIYDELVKNIDISHSRFFNQKSPLKKFFGLVKEMLGNNNVFVIGLSNGSLIKFTRIVKLINKKMMRQSIVMVMGGTLHRIINDNLELVQYFSLYKMIYVETESMKSSLNNSGLYNVSIFPNCRQRVTGITNYSRNYDSDGKLRCVYFSLISRDKGADIVIEAADILEKENANYKIDFYGHIDDSYESEFKQLINYNSNVDYKGVFKPSAQKNVYCKLMEYDVLLFPTRWKNEGVPGVLVESKLAGVPAIVSNINYNSEIIEHGINGAVLEDNSPGDLAESIKTLCSNQEMLKQFKNEAKESSEKFIIDNYITELVNIIKFNREECKE
jgi:glycosyltransferase involved in cell wall biosynthesis